MKAKFYAGLIAATLFAGSKMANAQVVANWTFETSQPTSAGNIAPEVGNGTLSVYHATTGNYNTPKGNGSAHSFLSTSWAADDYYLMDNINTAGISNVVLSFDMTGSNTGPKSFGIAYRTSNSGPYFVLGNITVTVSNITWSEGSMASGSSYSYTLPSALANQPDCEIKIYVLNDGSVNNGTIANAGTNRIDNLMISGSVPLPLHFKDFTADRKGTQNELKWITANEKDVQDYIVESSRNGKDFFEAARIKPYNNATENEYTYMDIATPDKLFYRISEMGKDGSKAYSKTVFLNDETFAGKGLNCNFNNTDNTIQFKSDGNYATLNYYIINAAGTIVAQQRGMNLKAGTNRVDAARLSGGLYIVKCEYGGKTYSFKIVR